MAKAEGELVLEGNCLRVGGADGYIIVWPPGFTPHVDDGIVEVRNGGGKAIARGGDYLVLGGGEAGTARAGKSVPCAGTYWDDTYIASVSRDGEMVYLAHENYGR